MGNQSTNWPQTMAKIAESARSAARPCNFSIGTVESAKPLKIRKSQAMLLDEDFLILTNAVLDHEIEVMVTAETKPADGHTHEITGKQKLVVHNALKEGESVLLLQQEGGQRYAVIDRVGKVEA